MRRARRTMARHSGDRYRGSPVQGPVSPATPRDQSSGVTDSRWPWRPARQNQSSPPTANPAAFQAVSRSGQSGRLSSAPCSPPGGRDHHRLTLHAVGHDDARRPAPKAARQQTQANPARSSPRRTQSPLQSIPRSEFTLSRCVPACRPAKFRILLAG